MIYTVTVMLEDDLIPHVWMFESLDIAREFSDGAYAVPGVCLADIAGDQIRDPSLVGHALAELRGLAGETEGSAK